MSLELSGADPSYGGIFETNNPAREYTLDDFVTLNLEKLDRFNHLRGTGLDEMEWRGSDDEDGGLSDSDSDEDEDDESSGDEEEEMAALEDEDEDDEAKESRHAALSQAEKVRQWNTTEADGRTRSVRKRQSSWVSQRTLQGLKRMFCRLHSPARTCACSTSARGSIGLGQHTAEVGREARLCVGKDSVSRPIRVLLTTSARIGPI